MQKEKKYKNSHLSTAVIVEVEKYLKESLSKSGQRMSEIMMD